MTSTDHFTAATATASANATAARTVPGATLRRNRARHFGIATMILGATMTTIIPAAAAAEASGAESFGVNSSATSIVSTVDTTAYALAPSRMDIERSI